MRPLIAVIIFGFALSEYAHSQPGDFKTVNFSRADSVADCYRGFGLKDRRLLAKHLTRDLSSDVEKFRAIFRWITSNISYDVQLYNEYQAKMRRFRYNLKKAAWTKHFERKTMARLINKKSAICSSYSWLLKEMCDHAGIPCITITGYGKTLAKKTPSIPNHAWNAVSLNHKWYLCDVTWASGGVDEGGTFRRVFDNTWFLTEPILFVANHYPRDPHYTFLIQRPTLKEFLQAPLPARGYFSNLIGRYAPRDRIIRTKKGDPVIFQFTSNCEKIDPVMILRITRAKFDEQVPIDLTVRKDGFYQASYCFARSGIFRIEVYINYSLTFTYRVHVA